MVALRLGRANNDILLRARTVAKLEVIRFFLFAGHSTWISARHEWNGERRSFPAAVLSAGGRIAPMLSSSAIRKNPCALTRIDHVPILSPRT
jgi:hypothetical protein